MTRTKIRCSALAGAILLLVGACGSGSDTITVEDAWGRTSPKVAANAAFYMTVTGGNSDDVLVAADTEACAVVELHETVMNDGVMQMRHLPDGIELGASETVFFEPGGKHIMCIDKKAEFVAGDTLSITLVFATSDDIVAEFEIRDE